MITVKRCPSCRSADMELCSDPFHHAQRPPASELTAKCRGQATRAREWEHQLLTKLPEDEVAAFGAIAESFRSMAVDFIAAADVCDRLEKRVTAEARQGDYHHANVIKAEADNAKLRALITKYLGMSNAAIDAALREPTGEKS